MDTEICEAIPVTKDFKEILSDKFERIKDTKNEYIIDNNMYISKKLAIIAMIEARQAELGHRSHFKEETNFGLKSMCIFLSVLIAGSLFYLKIT
ncbi:MAG: hypothetical protein WC188_03275 [Candidatus Caldatribacteriota bacterium]|jgi:hypothetical protein|nr:hypothetical protein [Patescibacteria group bacterium]